jgi:hypothetical protein
MTDLEPSPPAATTHQTLSHDVRTFTEPYSPELRTGLILTGTGTGGAYHAGVLRALHEAGVKIDIVGAHGIGVVGALFAAVDGAQRLWDEKGFWRSHGARTLYPWRRTLRLIVGALVLAIAIVAVPLGVSALGLLIYPIDFMLKMIGAGDPGGLLARYLRFTEAAFAPDALPTWLPRFVVLVLGCVGVVALATGWRGASRRRVRGPFWWRAVRPPLSSAEAVAHCWRAVWDLVRGAAQLKQPEAAELGRRYIELVAENLGQPGFRELVIAVHDLDAHRDLIFALVAESRRRDLIRRLTSEATEERRAEIFDLSGVARDYLVDVVAGALAVPVASEPSTVTFASDSYWRGETHRLCDRPASVTRILRELLDLGAEQLIVVSAATDSSGPHSLTAPRIDGRGRFGEYLQSAETATVRDTTRLAAEAPVKLFTIRPAHNPVGPFDFSGAFDDRSDRRPRLNELIARGYEDAYHQFIEPVVGASGDRVGQGAS